MTLDKSYVGVIERNIDPPMSLAITIPVDGLDLGSGFVVYVVQQYSLSGKDKEAELKDIASRLTLSEKPTV